MLVEHAESALEHAKKSENVATGEAKTHLVAGIKSLEDSIAHGKQNHAEIATKSAEEAVKHLEAANK